MRMPGKLQDLSPHPSVSDQKYSLAWQLALARLMGRAWADVVDRPRMARASATATTSVTPRVNGSGASGDHRIRDFETLQEWAGSSPHDTDDPSRRRDGI